MEKEKPNESFDIHSIRFDTAKILIVDDVPLNRELIKKFLESYKELELFEAENGKIAIEKATQILPDLILMDMKMPEMNGFEATDYLKKHPSTSSIPIIALTASALSHSKEEIQLICDDYIRKPVSREYLIKRLSVFLKTKTFETNIDDIQEHKGFTKQFSPSQIENLKELYKILKEEKLRVWESIQEIIIIDDIVNFSRDMIDLGNRYDYSELVLWAKRVEKYALLYDTQEMKSLLSQFPKILNRCQHLVL